MSYTPPSDIDKDGVINLINENNKIIFQKIEECCSLQNPCNITRKKSCRVVPLGTSLINGFAVVRKITYVEPYHPKPIKKQEPVKKLDPNAHLPKLVVGKGYVYPDGTISCLIPETYVDSNNKVIKPKCYWVGKKNLSICTKIFYL